MVPVTVCVADPLARVNKAVPLVAVSSRVIVVPVPPIDAPPILKWVASAVLVSPTIVIAPPTVVTTPEKIALKILLEPAWVVTDKLPAPDVANDAKVWITVAFVWVEERASVPVVPITACKSLLAKTKSWLTVSVKVAKLTVSPAASVPLPCMLLEPERPASVRLKLAAFAPPIEATVPIATALE